MDHRQLHQLQPVFDDINASADKKRPRKYENLYTVSGERFLEVIKLVSGSGGLISVGGKEQSKIFFDSLKFYKTGSDSLRAALHY